MKTYYKRDLKNTYMIIEEEEAEKKIIKWRCFGKMQF